MHSQSWIYFVIGRFALSQVVVRGERFETAHASYVTVYVIVTLVSIIHMLHQMRQCRRLLFVLEPQVRPKTPRHSGTRSLYTALVIHLSLVVLIRLFG